MLDYVPNDGYTESAVINALPGIHGEFRFTFRPMTREQRDPLLDYYVKPDKRSAVLAVTMAKKISEHVKSWSLVDSTGNAVPVSPEVAQRLKPALFTRIEDIVMGLKAGDTIEESGGLTATQLLEAEITGRPPGDVRTEADLKNLGPVCG